MTDLPDSGLIVPTRRQLPLSLMGKVHAIDTTGQAGDIARQLGRGSRPMKPVWIFMPDGQIVVVAGLGIAEASEIEDCALAAMHKRPFDFEVARDKAGLPPGETFDTRFRESRQRQVEYHKRHAVTDPGMKKHEKRVYQGGIS